ncbi:membrane-bound lytic murein transglycosylase MltF [Spectribacter hydrogenoxidans]|uniref:Membrane-bound lytic murein transglycosylase F n=1 Tax=Spectribacter hydrogenoxidans TaxID=3075608 RepID=A0ABU3C047_9GAMM|nr:membrane-bound lytic murein transglycosylase MltF [Salinisphaera sp. W335]MDT0634937.1 membrane-bound lytic murein transglycosylase MltF [Salinisphaera sp. W335]
MSDAAVHRLPAQRYRVSLRWVTILLALALLATCQPPVSPMAEIQATGILRVATVNSATTYYLGPAGPTGFEYDLAQAFADQLGVELDMQVVDTRAALTRAVRQGNSHFSVGLTATAALRRDYRLTPGYLDLQPTVVYQADDPTPDDLASLDGKLTVARDDAVTNWLRQAHPTLNFRVDESANAEELLARVAEGDIRATVADARLVQLNQRYYPRLRTAFTLPVTASRTWVFPAREHDALYNRAIAFLAGMRGDAAMTILRDRHFGHAKRLGFVGGQTFARIAEERLDRWRPAFETAAEENGLDWRLLAAVGYQESHWDPEAVSPTGVRGLMMLTEQTAEELGVADRTDPAQSIEGGARYIRDLRERLADGIEEPDRTWTALAAYNLGLGHVLDARELLRQRDRDPDSWINLRDALPWLTQKRYHSQTRYGYARGHEAVTYVGNVRAYYDILLWMTGSPDTEKPESLQREPETSDTAAERALDMNVPAL